MVGDSAVIDKYTLEVLKKLNPEQRAQYRALHYISEFLGSADFPSLDGSSAVERSHEPIEIRLRDLAILKTNTVTIDDHGKRDHDAYTELLRTREQRASVLRNWKFACECPACEGPNVAASERRRQRIFNVDQGFAIVQSNNAFMMSFLPPGQTIPKSAVAKLAWAQELVKLCIEEHILGLDLANAYRECSRYSLALGDNHLEEAIGYAQQELEVEIACVGAETVIENSARDRLATLLEKHEAGSKQISDGEEATKQSAEQVAYGEGKKAWEAAKKTVKKHKRVIRAVAKMAAVQEEAEKLLEALSPESIEALTGKLKGKTDALEVRAIIHEEMKGLKDDGQTRNNGQTEDELGSLE